MFSDDTLEKYARVLIWGLETARRKPFKKSELVLVRYDLPALPLAEAVCARLHDLGRLPVVRANPSPRMERDFYEKANNKRLGLEIPGDRELFQSLGGSINLIAPAALNHLAGVDPDQLRIHRRSRRGLQSILSKREELGEYSWTACLYPTPALAMASGLTIEEYAAEIKKACLLTSGSPVTEWKLLYKKLQEIKDWLNSLKIQTIRVQSKNVDLLLRVGEKRKWIAVSGRNIPSFEIYTSPDWRGTEGAYFADQPSLVPGGTVRGVELEFRRGLALKARAEQGLPQTMDRMNMDPGSNRLGEFALVDKRFSPITKFMANTLYDENHGGENGSCHVALGQSYSNTFDGPAGELSADAKRELGFNTSILHWDLVNTEDKVVTASLADGSRQIIYENGRFVI